MAAVRNNQLSVIIPALNEAEYIHATLVSLQALRASGHEIILVDGGSHDNTVALAEPLTDQVIRSVRGRSRQTCIKGANLIDAGGL
jgi:glycosyltransferase involved in cell wall biosynthesis